METLNFYNLLSYGAIGLGCILAVLAYFLLRDEQKQPKPRKQFLTSVYVFMGFTLALSLFGFGAELWKDSVARDAKTASEKVAELQGDLEKRDTTIAGLQVKYDGAAQKLSQVEQKMSSSRELLDALMHQKEGKVNRLKELQPGTPSYTALVDEIQKDLTRIDDGIRDAIKK